MSGRAGDELGGDRGSKAVSEWCWVLRRFSALLGGVSNTLLTSFSSETGFNGLEGVWHLFRADAVRSRRARLDALGGRSPTLDRGVKKRPNLRGVMDGSRLSLPWLDCGRGGDEIRLRAMVVVVLAAVDNGLRVSFNSDISRRMFVLTEGLGLLFNNKVTRSGKQVQTLLLFLLVTLQTTLSDPTPKRRGKSRAVIRRSSGLLLVEIRWREGTSSGKARSRTLLGNKPTVTLW
jgi:hypothetical protein